VRDVLVVGGGPAGSATAILAARAGLDVLLVDRAAFPRDKPCAQCLNPEATRDLADLGVLAEIEAAAPPRLAGMRIVSDDGTAVTGYYDRQAGASPPTAYGLAVVRTVLDTALVRSAARGGVDVRERTAVERLIIESGVVRGAVVRRHGERLEERCRVVVGADGLNSLVARNLGLAVRGHPRRLGLAAHLTGVRGLNACGEMFCGRGWYVGIVALGGGVAGAAMVVPLADHRAIAQDREGYFRARLASLPELAERTAGAEIVREILTTGPFARRTRRPIADGALLVGDAADFFDPFTGEGVFAALRGGRLAADAIASALASGGAASRARLEPYAEARGRVFRDKRLLERVAGLSVTRPLVMRRFTRRLAAHPGLADLWVGAAGGRVSVRTLFAPRNLAALLGGYRRIGAS
jgi:flavin-dependent dehydrogenase